MKFLPTLIGFSMAFAGSAAAQVTVPETDIVLVAPSVEVEGYEPFDYAADPNLEVTLDDADVYSSITGEDIGEVDDVHTIAATGQTHLELEIGGFLDIGDKDVAVPLDQVSIYRGTDGYRVYIAATEEQLESYPEFND
ncbi:MAG: PRC-barrel domain-containing protein [Pseudorhizobium sp.]